MNLNSRNPTAVEVQDALAYYKSEWEQPGELESAAEDLLSQASIAVIDHFISDGPGYTGRIMFVVFSGGPECHDVLTYDNGKLNRCKRDGGP